MTAVDGAALLLRIVVGAIFVAHGYQKTLAPAEAHHGRASLVKSIAGAGFPAAAPLAWIVGSVELVGGALLLVGALTAVAALGLSAVLVMVIVRFKWSAGFVGGWDWPLACLGGTLALVFLGAGAFSIDALLGW